MGSSGIYSGKGGYKFCRRCTGGGIWRRAELVAVRKRRPQTNNARNQIQAAERMLVTLFLQERLEPGRGVGLLLHSKIVKTGKEVVHRKRRNTRVDEAGRAITDTKYLESFRARHHPRWNTFREWHKRRRESEHLRAAPYCSKSRKIPEHITLLFEGLLPPLLSQMQRGKHIPSGIFPKQLLSARLPAALPFLP